MGSRVVPMPKTVRKVAALDLGKVRVGLAVSDELGQLAHPRAPLDAKNRKALLGRLRDLAREEPLGRFLIGMPLALTGEHGPAARRAVSFAQQVADITGLEVEMVDERLSTVEAEGRLAELGLRGRETRQRIDGAAAAILLQSWLDARRGLAD